MRASRSARSWAWPRSGIEGEVFSNPYAVAVDGGDRIVADAGANTLVRVRPNGATSVMAVFPPVAQTITQAVVDAVPEEFDGEAVSACLGETYEGEFVPTDVEVGPDGHYYVTSLPGVAGAAGCGVGVARRPADRGADEDRRRSGRLPRTSRSHVTGRSTSPSCSAPPWRSSATGASSIGSGSPGRPPSRSTARATARPSTWRTACRGSGCPRGSHACTRDVGAGVSGGDAGHPGRGSLGRPRPAATPSASRALRLGCSPPAGLPAARWSDQSGTARSST
jgi:hypothetical protein